MDTGEIFASLRTNMNDLYLNERRGHYADAGVICEVIAGQLSQLARYYNAKGAANYRKAGPGWEANANSMATAIGCPPEVGEKPAAGEPKELRDLRDAFDSIGVNTDTAQAAQNLLTATKNYKHYLHRKG
jgi:hypothetical protein